MLFSIETGNHRLGHSDNEKFGEIVLRLGFCTPEQIRRCLEIQGDTTENLSLGNSLLREGFISREQYSEVLKVLRASFKQGVRVPDDTVPSAPPRSASTPEVPTADDRTDDLVGQLALREGWLTPAHLKACLQAEKPGARRRGLAEILVSRGYLTPQRAKDLLARVSRRSMCCRPCRTAFTVLSIANSPEILCPKCRGRLEEGNLSDLRPAKDPLATQIYRAVSTSLKSPPRPGPR